MGPEEVASMTLPGKMLTDAVDRLAQSIAASKQTSDELKGRTAPAPVTPIPVGEVTGEPGGDTGRETA